MVNLPAVLIANGAAIVLLVIVMLSRKSNIRYGLIDEKLYILMVWLCIVLCLAEMLSFIIDGANPEIYRIPAIFVNSVIFSTCFILILVWTLYIYTKLFEDTKRTRRLIPFLCVPAVFIVICCIINLFTPIFFSISADNIYIRAPLHFFPFFMSYGYLLYGIVITYRKRKETNRYLFMPVVVFLIPVFIGSVIQYCIYGISLLWLGTAIGLVSLYINVQNAATYIDSLSGIFNRQYLSFYLNAWSDHVSQKEQLVGFMLDIDEFKLINDKYGHLAGDSVIEEVGRLLRTVTGKNGLAARYGGDEFIVLLKFKRNVQLDINIQKVLDSLEALTVTTDRPFPIRLSIGTSIFKDDDTVDTFINRIDAAMYNEKNKKIDCNLIPDRRKKQDLN